MSISQHFLRFSLIFAVLGAGIAAAQLPEGTKRPIRKNLFNRVGADLTDPSGKEKKPDDILRVKKQRNAGLEFDSEFLPDFRDGDMQEDEEMEDLEKEREDFLNPEWLKPIDPAGEFANKSMDELRGDVNEDSELERMREDEERLEAEREERREFMREMTGQKDPFDYLENKSRLAEHKRGRPEEVDRIKSTETSPDASRDDMARNASRAHTNLDKRGVEKIDAASAGITEAPQIETTGGRFARANKGSLLGGMGTGSMVDNLNKKYRSGTDLAGKSASQEASRSRMRRAFVERNGGVDWRSDLRGPDRQRQRLDPSLPGNSSMLAGSTSFSGEQRERPGLGAFELGDEPRAAGGGIIPALGSAISVDNRTASLRVAGDTRSSTRSVLDDEPKKAKSGGFDWGSGIKSGFDTDGFIRNPGKF